MDICARPAAGVKRTSGINEANTSAFTFFLVPSSDFSDAREATLRAAREIHGAESPEERAVRDGWNAVRSSGIRVAGLGMDQIDRIESIFYRAFMFFLVSSSDFSNAREATLRAAREIHGAGSPEERTVRDGWNAVGVR